MKIGVVLKSISNPNKLQRVEYNLRDDISTLRDLILNLVEIEIDKYEESPKEKLSSEEIEDMMKVGKVAFGIKYNNAKIDIDSSKEVALFGFEDGLYRVFKNEDEIESLDDKLELKQSDELSFIRLTMFCGSRV